MVVEMLSEQLRTPAFRGDEIDKLKTRMIGQLEQSLEDTKKQALISFLRLLYRYFKNLKRFSKDYITSKIKIIFKNIIIEI